MNIQIIRINRSDINLETKVQQVVIDPSKEVADLVSAAEFDHIRFEDQKELSVPIPGKLYTAPIIMAQSYGHPKELTNKLRRQGNKFRPATPFEALCFLAKYPKLKPHWDALALGDEFPRYHFLIESYCSHKPGQNPFYDEPTSYKDLIVDSGLVTDFSKKYPMCQKFGERDYSYFLAGI